jgi:hypothetical protein
MMVQLMGEKDIYMRSAISAEDKLDEMRKKEEQDKNIRRLLHELTELCKCQVKFNDDHEPTVWVEEIEPDYTKLIEWFKSLRIEDQTTLLSKVKTESSMIEAILNALARFPKRKTTQEEIMEFTLFPRQGN